MKKIRRHVYITEAADVALRQMARYDQSGWLSRCIRDQLAREAHATAYLSPVEAPTLDAAFKRMAKYPFPFVDDQEALSERMRGISTPAGIDPKEWEEFCDVIESDLAAANALVVLGRVYWAAQEER